MRTIAFDAEITKTGEISALWWFLTVVRRH